MACLLLMVPCGCSTTTQPTGSAETAAVGSDTSGIACNSVTADDAGDDSLARAFAEQAEDVEVEGQGTVSKLLSDDNEGDRHQRFIVRLASGQTVLITHNIDVAPRVSSLQVGDTVAFKGEYVWNAQGGLVHWTHDDPDGSHVAGWIRHNGRWYQ